MMSGGSAFIHQSHRLRAGGRVGYAFDPQRLLDEAVTLRRPAAARLGTPAASDDLANLLRMIGDAAQARQDFENAEAAYRESLTISNDLAERAPSPRILRGLSLTLERFGKLAILFDATDRAVQIFEDRFRLDLQLAESYGTPADWRNLMSSRYWLADIAEQRGALEEAERGYEEALDIARDIASRTPTAGAREDVRPILARLARLARRRGDESRALALEHEMRGEAIDVR